MLALDKDMMQELHARWVSRWHSLRREPERDLYQIELTVTDMHPRDWLHQGLTQDKVYWCSRDDTFELAGLGCVDEFMARTPEDVPVMFDRLHYRLKRCVPGLRYFGGMAFNLREAAKASWRPWGIGRFRAPRWACQRRDGKTALIVTSRARTEHMQETLWAELQRILTHPSDSAPWRRPAVATFDQHPQPAAWQHQINRIKAAWAGIAGKIVPSVKETYQFVETLHSAGLFRHIMQTSDHTYRFFLSSPEGAFMGASPECLYQRRGRTLTTEALAGTLSGTMNHLPDADVLFRSAKDNLEHDLVIRDIQEALAPLCAEVTTNARKEALGWRDLIHLRTKLSGSLHPLVSDQDILEALHPSAAVLGYPRDRAWHWLARHEGHERGWYAGPVGWLGRDRAEFAVAIRSALAVGKRLEIWAGAGIVSGSEPEQEWYEIQHKLRPYHEALNLESA